MAARSSGCGMLERSAAKVARSVLRRECRSNSVLLFDTCKDADRGFFTYYCENCGTVTTVHFGCNSRICTNCGKNHTDKWSKSLSKALFNVPHRHAVLTISNVLWSVVRENRFLFKVLMDAAIAAINDTISYKNRNGRLVAGAVVVLHPFSKNMGFNPHLHILVNEGGFDKTSSSRLL
jgi:hypothetical protein